MSATAAALAAAVVALGGVGREAEGLGSRPASVAPISVAAAGADRLVRLGAAHQQRMRETGEPVHLTKAEAAYRAALRADERHAEAFAGLARLALSRHEFRKGLDLARRARSLAPEVVEYIGIVGDALVELGRYREAFRAYDAAAGLKPDLGAYARIAQARLLLGDTDGAIQAFRLALDTAGFRGEPAGWVRVQLANVYLDSARLEAAERLYREALVVDPGAAHGLAGLADVALARGRAEEAVGLYRHALALEPKPEFAISLGDVLSSLHRRREAEHAYRRAEQLERRLARHGVHTELDRALFALDHDRDLRAALDLAWAGYRLQPGLEGSHVLAWALYKHGRCAEARRFSVRALRLGTNDLDAIYHRSLIERCLGNERASASFASRLRALNPLYEASTVR